MKTARPFALAIIFIISIFGVSLAMAHGSDDGDDERGGRKNCAKTRLVKFNGTIAQAAAQTPDLSTLYSLVGLAGLDAALDGPGPLTVYAPVNSAFAEVPAGLVNLLTSDPKGLLTSILSYHVTVGTLDPRKQRKIKEVSTLQGQSVFLNGSRNAPQVNQSNIVCQGVKATNGVVWLIDSVLLPQF